MSILITGGAGFLASHVTRKLVEEGLDIVIFDRITTSGRSRYKRISDILDRVKIFLGDFTSLGDVLGAIKQYEVEDIIHMGALLSSVAEQHPLEAVRVNVEGTVNVLEAARFSNLRKVVMLSSVGVYGRVQEPVTDETPREGVTVYAITKVFGEQWGLYYHNRYGVDFRALRFPAIVGPGRVNGAVTAYTSLMIQKPTMGEPYEVNVDEGSSMPIIYCKDAANAISLLYKCKDPKTRIYNIAGITPSAGKIADTVKKYVPDATIKFTPRSELVRAVQATPKRFDEKKAQEELGWRLSFTLDELVKDFVTEVKSKPHLYR